MEGGIKMKLGNNKLEIILGTITIVSIFIAIFALNRTQDVKVSKDEHLNEIHNIEDSIRVVSNKIDSIGYIINSTIIGDLNVKKQIEKVNEDEKETDHNIDNGSWDYNIKFLTDYLSKKDSIGF